MQTLNSLLVCIVLACGMAWGQTSACLQDQFGNQYKIDIDLANEYIYGAVTNHQGCRSTAWPLIGSFVGTAAGIRFELTAANPSASPDSCVPVYKLKGTLPNFQWYYADGGGNGNAGRWTACGAAVADKPAGKGARR